MHLRKKIFTAVGDYNFCLAQSPMSDSGTDPIVETGNFTLSPLYHIIFAPEVEGAFNLGFHRRSGLNAESIANFIWGYSDRQVGLKALITFEFARSVRPFHWNLSIIPWRDGKAISIVCGEPKAMEMVYERRLRTHQPQT